ncbi:MAG: hypothetical protein ACK5II_09050 [Paracoccus sp. (in: a-proteobacteria)]
MVLKQILVAGIAVSTLAGCAIPNDQAVPDDVILIGNRLTVIFSNGMQCHANNVTGSVTGTFTDCPVPARYDVMMQSSGYFGNGVAEPHADILVTMPDGREKLLKTPESRNWTERGLSDSDDD